MTTIDIGVNQVTNLGIIAPASDTVCVLTAIGDFNADGRIDFAISAMDLGLQASETSDIRLLLAQENGTFVDGTHLLGPKIPSYQGSSLISVDLNWDGYTDLVLARSGGDPDTTDGLYADTQLIYLSDGSGGYRAIESETKAYAHNGMVADVNGDSRADAFFFATGEGPSILMLNETQTSVGLSFTFDGLPPQAIHSDTSSSWTVIDRYPNGALKKMQGWHQHNSAFNDVDRDGDLDMVMFFGSGSNELLVYKNDGSSRPNFNLDAPIVVDARIPKLPSSGNYYYGILGDDGSWAGLRSTGQGANYYETTQFDVDGDGHEDIVALASSNNFDYTSLTGQSYFDSTDAPGTDRYNHGTFFGIFINNGEGLSNETGSRVEQPNLRLSGDQPGHTGYIFNLVSVDLNGDGHLDFLSNNSANSEDAPNYLGESSTVFMLNDGSGNFSQIGIDGLEWGQLDPLPLNGKLGFVSTTTPLANNWSIPGHPPRPDFNFNFYQTKVPWTIGDEGNNFVYGTPANDQIDGGLGIDTYIALGRREEFDVEFPTPRQIEVADNLGLSGIDLITNVERLKFYDQQLAFDLQGNAGTAAKILGALWGKESVENPTFVGIVLHYLDSGVSYEALLDLALGAILGANKTNEAIVELVFTNLVGEAPTQAVKAELASYMDSGAYSQAGFARAIADLELNATNINLVGLSDMGLQYTEYVP